MCSTKLNCNDDLIKLLFVFVLNQVIFIHIEMRITAVVRISRAVKIRR